MVTLFDMLQWIGALAGAVIGSVRFDRPGAVGGAIVGFFLGAIVGRIPFAIAWSCFRFRVKRRSIDRLKQDLEQQYFVSHLLIAELVVRGEPVEQFWPYILSLLGSDSSDERRFGWANLQLWLPRLAARIEGWNPHDSAAKCREQLRAIEDAEPDAGPLPSEDASSEGG